MRTYRLLIFLMAITVGLLFHGNAYAANEANRLELQQQITVDVGTTEVVLPIMLVNEAKMTGFQCDLYLPEGFTVATDEYDDYQIDITRTTAKRHSLAARMMDDGALRIVLSSMTNATFSGNSGVVLNVTLAIAPGVKQGSYTVSLKNNVLTDPQAVRYTSSDVSGTIVVKAQPVTIKANNVTMVYGDDVPALSYTSEGAELTGVPSLTCAATPTSPVGTYSIVVSQGTVTNSDVSYVNGTLTITKAPLTIAAGTYTKKQGEAMPELTLTYTGFKNNETKNVLTKQPTVACSATVASAPGEYPVTVSGAQAQNYAISYVNGKLIVTDADAVTVKAKSYTREYGDANPAFEFTVEGAALDGVPEISCEATATSPVGTYDIVVKKGTVKNYNVTYVAGKLTITKAPLTIAAGTYEKRQGEPMPEFTLTYTGFKNGETSAVLTKQPVISCAATVASEPGEYPVTVSGARAQNYAISYVNGKLVVTPNPQSKGDLNGDGKVSITDVVMIIDVIAGIITDADKVAAADVNDDGNVSITDCVAAIDLIAAQQPAGARMVRGADSISSTERK